MKIGIFAMNKDDEDTKYLLDKLRDYDIVLLNQELNKKSAEKLKNCEIICGYGLYRIDKEVLSKLKKLKLICTISTGYDNIDVDYCKKNGIGVSNVPYYGSEIVAEHTFALILTISRNLKKFIANNLKKKFWIDDFHHYTGFELFGKTLGVIGTGSIGKHVIRIAKGFGMNVIAYDLITNKDLENQLGFRYVSYEYLLSNADIISLHVPYNEKNKYLINEESISIMKKGVIIINTARGELVDTAAIIKWLKKGKIYAYAADVVEGEAHIRLFNKNQEIVSKDPYSYYHEIMVQLLSRDNFVFTYHNAFNSKEAIQRLLDTTANNIISFINGKQINSVVPYFNNK
ncbi:MAG: NAD(P)-binding domain-containing protein [Candidatus Micrarchaeota archaeon]|nr:NAD(P)-binding domain-containing protein [Candidatus Micrarchaeota archaeon]